MIGSDRNGSDCDSGGAIDLGDVAHVAEAFFAGGLRFEVVLDAVGEVIGFGDEVGGIAGGVELVDLGALVVGGESESLVGEGIIDLEPAFGAVDAEIAGHVGAVGGGATGDNAGGEAHGPCHVFFDLVEAAVVVDDRGVGGDVFRLFAGEVAAGVEGIDAYVEERSATGHLLAEPPLAGGDVESEGAIDGLDLAERTGANELDGKEVGGFVVAAVGDHELDVGGLAGGDHLLGLGDVEAHGLFAEDVFAGLGGADGVFGVHGVWERDIDCIDGGVVRDLVKVFVVIDGVSRDVVLCGDAVGLVAMAADECGDLRVGGIENAAHEVICDASEADDGVTGLAANGLGIEGGDEVGG